MIMDRDDSYWVAPVLFSIAAAVSLFALTRGQRQNTLLNEANDQPPIQRNELKALFKDSAFDLQFEKLLSDHKDINSPPNEYLDPYTLHIMDDPVTLSDNQTYNRNTAEYLLKYETLSPITRDSLDKEFYEENVQLRENIQGWITALNFEYNQDFSLSRKAMNKK